MKVPISWLKDYVELPIAISDLAQRLTLAGLEVESIEYLGLPQADLPWVPDKIFVGEIRAVRPHPNADRLVLVDVAYGATEEETVVTGAPSLLERRGQSDLHLKVPFATEGAQLYDGHAEGRQVMTLKKAKIRGISSRAMVCSEKELGISEEHEDILYLPQDAPVGTPLVDYMGDAVLEFDIKGPFGHLESIFGVAREVAALLDLPLKDDALQVLQRQSMELTPEADFLDLRIADPDLCPRYSAAFIRGASVQPSPFWLQLRLQLAGMRPINNVVDATNYVMLELGQPLHAFDYHDLNPQPGAEQPAIIVRRARPGEKMITLDGVERTFDENMLLITDGTGPVAVAGVMGGLESEVTEETTDILLESANFNFLNVRRTSRLLGLNSEASQRFGRRVDPELAVKAAARAAHLIAELGGGEVRPRMADLYPGQQPQKTLKFDPSYATRILGVQVPTDEMVRILTSLGFEVSRFADSAPASVPRSQILQVAVPSHRQDIDKSIDLVEEVGRIWGYDHFPPTVMRDELPPQRANPRLEGAEQIREVLVGCGLDEVITYSLTNLEEEGKLRPQGPPPDPEAYLHLLNPLSADRATLRQTLLPGMLNTARENLRFLDRVNVFEIGAIYIPVEGQTLPEEPRQLGIVMTGPRESRSWIAGQDRTPLGFYDLKGVVEALLERLAVDGVFETAQHPAFHPGRCARVRAEGEEIGVLGELHPLVLEAFELPSQPICALEFDVEVLLASWGTAQTMRPISAHPPVYEDLAVVVDEDVPAAEVCNLILQTGSALVRSAVLFDRYRGKQIEPGKKSLAFRLTYQAPDRTLTDREVARLREKIVRRLERELKATLRG